MKKYHFLYKTTCSVNSKHYYGMHSTDNLDDGYLGSGFLLTRSIKAYGKDCHVREILEFADDRVSLRIKERNLITADKINDELCLNLKLGGEGGWEDVNQWPSTRLRSLSEEQRSKISESLKGRVQSEETRTKISESNKGKHHITHSEESKQKIREGNLKMKGEKNGFFGRKHTEEAKAKMKEARARRTAQKTTRSLNQAGS